MSSGTSETSGLNGGAVAADGDDHKAPAEAEKELGNKAYAAKEYDKAIAHYTAAIKLDPKNHIFYSNRSACQCALSKWPEAAEDALASIKLDPTFLKSFFRLATAQIELNQLDEANATVQRGLALDPSNAQLLKQLRIINGKRKDAERADKRGALSGSTSRPVALDASTSKEVLDLREQLATVTREYNITRANLNKCQREMKMSEMTTAELEKLPAADGDGGVPPKMYRSIGKMFMQSNRTEIMSHLADTTRDDQKRVADLTSKLEYLEKRMASARQNIVELTGVGDATLGSTNDAGAQ